MGQAVILRVGLVLGGGGVVGVAYHAAALAAIERDLGWEPRPAEVVVGTSAGSLVGPCCAEACPPPTCRA
jgi:NTE family protein